MPGLLVAIVFASILSAQTPALSAQTPTETNDPLANTLSVTAPRWLERLHLQFGYHVEHHLFPTMSGRHAPKVREVLRGLYGDRYLTMPHVQALRLLYSRPKIHDGHDVLIDIRTRERFAVLAPGDRSMSRLTVA